MKSWYQGVKRIGSKRTKASRVQNSIYAKCEHCGEVFLTTRSHAKTCSAKCRVAKSRVTV